MIKREIERMIRSVVAAKFPGLEDAVFEVEAPKQRENGDYASNAALSLAKRLGRQPRELAEELAAELGRDERGKKMLSQVEVAGPGFINFYINDATLHENVFAILDKGEKYGRSRLGKGQTVVIDYSAINIAKPMHVGHLRSTIIGQALYNIYASLGYKVIGDNHIGDWGTQFGKMIYAYKNWGDKKLVAKDPVEEMTKLYVRFHKEAEQNAELEELARAETRKLQAGDDENTKLWNFMVRCSLKDAGRIYKLLGVKFDYVQGESFYKDMLPGVVQDAEARHIAEQSEGAMVIKLDERGLPPFLIQKSDGAFLYATSDLATAKYRKEKWHADKLLYVVANEQALHFEQLFASLELLGYCPDAELRHVKFGMVLGEEGKKFSTRKGDTKKLEDLIAKALSLAQQVVEEKNPTLSRKEKKRIARTVGIGAMKYNDLSQNRLTDITFNWDRMLAFDGNSAPYLQYTYARICSVLDRHKKENRLEMLLPAPKARLDLLKEECEKELLRSLIKYPDAVRAAAQENGPHLIALYLFNLASTYNTFYNSYPILKADKDLTRARLVLSEATAVILKNGLGLLGIEVTPKM